MKFPFEEWTDRERGLKRQNEKETRGRSEQWGASWRNGEWGGSMCVRDGEIWGAGGQAMGVQLKVHTLAKIWVLSRQSSCRPFQGTHHTKAMFEEVVGSANWHFFFLTEALQPSYRPLWAPRFNYFSFLSSFFNSALTRWYHGQASRWLGQSLALQIFRGNVWSVASSCLDALSPEKESDSHERQFYSKVCSLL